MNEYFSNELDFDEKVYSRLEIGRPILLPLHTILTPLCNKNSKSCSAAKVCMNIRVKNISNFHSLFIFSAKEENSEQVKIPNKLYYTVNTARIFF